MWNDEHDGGWKEWGVKKLETNRICTDYELLHIAHERSR